MKQKTTRLLSFSIIIMIFAGLFAWPQPVFAGTSEWSAETIPGLTDNVLGPAGVDISDFVIGNDDTTIYAVPGNSIAAHVVYKSINAGVGWTAIPISIQADLIAVSPVNKDIIVIANNSTPEVQLSVDGGVTWNNLHTPQAAAGAPAAVISDLAISDIKSGIQYIAAAGRDAVNGANMWYFPYGPAAPTWQETNGLTGFLAQSEVAAIEFSPGFTSDATLAAVTGNASSGVKLQVLDFSNLKWNDAVSYPGYPCTVVSANITGLTSASLTLAPDYDGGDSDYRDLFIGLTIAGDASAVAASGIYRLKNTTKASILLDKQVHSVAFNHTYLIAGLYNDTLVYRIQSPLASMWTVKTSSTTKYPGGVNKVKVAWLGSYVAAGTAGNESAFAISKDSGTTFNDVSLIDTVITNARDVALSASGAKVYFVTDDGADTSLWYKYSSVWTRVFSLKGITNCIVRNERQSGSVVYLAAKGGTTVYYNSSSGSAQWQARNCNITIQDIAVESTLILYVLDTVGKVSESVNNGIYWLTAVDTTLTSGGMIFSISTDKLLAGSQDGYVAYSLNANTSWTKIPQPVDSGIGKIHVIPDQNFASNKTIYAASETAGKNIMKWQIDVNTSWTDIFNETITGGVYGLAIDSNTLYALEYSALTGQSTLWRFIAPTSATATSTDWVAITTTTATDPDGSVRLDATPQGLKTSAGKLWAVKTNGTKKLYSLTDSATDITITLQQPEDEFSVRVNSFSGLSYDIAFFWDRPAVASEYELRIALDPDFYSLAASIIIVSSDNPVFSLIGPHQIGARNVNFSPGTTYYWKIRTTKPGYSLYSDVRTFTIEPTIITSGLGLGILAPVNGAVIADTTPAFSWAPLIGVTEYEFVLSENVTMSPPLLDAKVGSPAIQVLRTLERGKTYFWRVRSTSPVESEWSAIANFVVKELVPLVTTVEPVTETITLTGLLDQTEIVFQPAGEPRMVTPGYLMFSIFIASILLASVIVLIFNRQSGTLFSFIHKTEDLGPVRRPKVTGRTPVTPREKPVSSATTAKPVIPSTEKPAVRTAPPKPVKPAIETAAAPPAPEKSKDAEAVIFATKSFLWISSSENKPAETVPELGDKERESLGKMLAGKIQDLARKELLYVRHPEEAALLLNIWSKYGSGKETSRYLAESFKNRPDNVIKLIKCYVAPVSPPDAGDPAAGFTRDSYNAIAQVIDPDKVYAALMKVFKFKLDAIEETTPVKPSDRNIAFKFMRLHLQGKK